MTAIITPKILKGTRDFLPPEMAKRRYVMEKIRSVFANFGYDTIETPAIEYAETLLGKYGEEGNKLTYSFEDNGGRKIALRYDQTVPFARLVAANSADLPMPFKRYQIDKVWRADKPAKGRYREFVQCDIDIIGTENLLAEGEITRVMYEVFKRLGFKKFIIKFNSRRLINSILTELNIAPEKQTGVIRVLDKLDKIGRDAVAKELEKIISPESVAQLLDTVVLNLSNKEKIANLTEYESAEIKEFLSICEDFGIPEENLIFDPSLARGLDYYTGITFEVFVPDVAIGAVCAGGRYDDLCSLFCEEKFSGVGVAFGFDRIVLAMEELKLLADARLNPQVMVTNFEKDVRKKMLELTIKLQSAGINTEIYFEPAKLSRQFKYADKKEIPFVVICGPEEIAKQEVTVKVMKTGKQKTIPQSQLVEYLNGFRS